MVNVPFRSTNVVSFLLQGVKGMLLAPSNRHEVGEGQISCPRSLQMLGKKNLLD